jgi:hypothetical protein
MESKDEQFKKGLLEIQEKHKAFFANHPAQDLEDNFDITYTHMIITTNNETRIVFVYYVTQEIENEIIALYRRIYE